MKKLKVIAILLALGIIFTGCNMIEVNEERDRETVIAKVDDEVVLKGEFLDEYNMYSMYGYFPEDFATNPDYEEMYVEQVEIIIDSLVDTKVLEIKAREKGCYDFTAEEREELDTEINNLLDTYVGMYAMELMGNPEYADMSEADVNTAARNDLDTYFKNNNFGVTTQDIIDDYESSKAQELLFDLATKDVVVTEDEVKAEYDTKVEASKASYEDGTANFESDVQNGTTYYYVPEGARKAKHILISIPDDIQQEIDDLTNSGDIAGADLKKKEALASIRSTAQAAYDRAVAGEDFDLLISELGEDPGMETNEFYVVMNPTSVFAAEFVEGLFSLSSIGEITEPVETDFGYHIIKYCGDVEAGAVAFEDVYDDIYDELLSTRKDASFEEQLNAWREETEIKTYYNRVTN